MTMTRERHVIIARRKNRKGEKVEGPLLSAGARLQTDAGRYRCADARPINAASLRHRTEFARWLAMGSRRPTASATPRARCWTRTAWRSPSRRRGAVPVMEQSVGWLVTAVHGVGAGEGAQTLDGADRWDDALQAYLRPVVA